MWLDPQIFPFLEGKKIPFDLSEIQKDQVFVTVKKVVYINIVCVYTLYTHCAILNVYMSVYIN